MHVLIYKTFHILISFVNHKRTNFKQQFIQFTIKSITMSVVKVLELMANSTKSWEDAAQQAVSEANKSLQNIRSVYIKEMSAAVENGKISEYRVTVKLSFELESKEGKTKK